MMMKPMTPAMTTIMTGWMSASTLRMATST